MRVLISAFACSPLSGSEHAIGWNIVTRLAKDHDVTVLTGDLKAEMPHKADLDKWIAEHGQIKHLNFVHVPPTFRICRWEKIHRFPGAWFAYYRAYRLWQREAFSKAACLHREEPFDLCHQLTITTYREPGYLWSLRIPFFWGPIGGVENVPMAFFPLLGLGEHGKVISRDLLNRLQLRLGFRSARAARNATYVWGSSRGDLSAIKSRWHARGGQLLETGTFRNPPRSAHVRRGSELKLMWSGLHVARKALPILLRALTGLPKEIEWSLRILGGGPCSSAWKTLARELGFGEKKISWTGQLGRDEALQQMSEADLFVHTGVKEGSTNVIMEALSFGMPVICHDAGGMGFAVNETCGIKIPLKNPKTSISGFREAIRSIAVDPALYERLAAGATLRASQLTWDEIATQISGTYTSCLEKSPK